METLDLLGGIVGALLTVLILSYFLRDNPLYRLALYLLVGASVGYAVAVVVATVLIRAVVPLFQSGTPQQQYTLILPTLLGLFLLFKFVPRLANLGNFATAFLIGVGAAVAMGGALLGTILPQASASGGSGGFLVALGTVCTLLAFTFTLRRRQGLQGVAAKVVNVLGAVGRFFLMVAFGAAFAAALTASLSVLVGRAYVILEGLQSLLHILGR